MKRFGVIERYISSEYIFSLLISFLFFFFIFFINNLLVLAEQILSKRVPILKVLELIFYTLPTIIALSIPFSSLVGALMAIGRFSSDNEFLSMQCLGIPLRRLFIPLFILSLIISLFSFVINDYFLPRGTIKFWKVYQELIYSTPELELESYSIKRIEKITLVTGLVENNIIQDLVIFDEDTEGRKRVIMSESAVFDKSKQESGVLKLHLSDITIQITDSENSFIFTEAEEMNYHILLKDVNINARNLGPREMSSWDVFKEILIKEDKFLLKVDNKYNSSYEFYNELLISYNNENWDETVRSDLDRVWAKIRQNTMDIKLNRTLRVWLLEYYQKFSMPFSSLFFIFLALPLGLFSKRSGKSVGFGLGLLICVLYYGLMIGGRTIGIKTEIDPVLIMWMPNMIIILLALFLTMMRGYK